MKTIRIGRREDLHYPQELFAMPRHYTVMLSPLAAEFAVACIQTNSVAELEAPHSPADADETDLRTWNITAQEWSDAIEVALAEKRELITSAALVL
jgi:hypothetical protein